MATNEERLAASAAWLRANKDKAQTPEFKRVAEFYKTLRTAPPTQAQAQPAPQGAAQASPEQPSTTLEGVAGNFAGGAADALLTLPGAVNDLMLMGVDKVAQQFGARPMTPEQYAQNPFGAETTRGMLRDYIGPNVLGPEAKTTAEQYARRIGEFVGPGAALAPAKMLSPIIASSVMGGIGSRAAQDAFPENPWAPVLGGIAGGFAPSAVTAARNARVPTAGMNAETAKLAQKMLDEGIDILPGQVGSKASKIAYDAVSKLPFMGDKARQSQLRQFNAAIARTFGESADAITPEVMARARGRIGTMFDEVFDANTINADRQLLDDLADVQVRATSNLTDAQANDVGKMVATILNEFNKSGGTMKGRVYSALTNKGGALQNLTSSADPNIKFYAGQVRDKIDDAFTRVASAEDVAKLNTAKTQYRAMKTIQDLVPKAADGNISPALLLGKVMTNDKNMAYTGGGKLGTLARGGQRFLKEVAGSQTPERTAIYQALGAGGAAALAPQAIVPAAAIWGGARLVKALLESKQLGARMVAGALRRANGNARKFDPRVLAAQAARGSIPGAVGQSARTTNEAQ